MIEILNNQLFHLYNEKISYVINLLPNNHLGHAYFGKSLGPVTFEDISYMTSTESKSAGTVKFSQTIQNFTLHDQHQEVPVYGTSDFQEGILEVMEGSVPLYLDFQYVSHSLSYEKTRNLAKPATFAEKNQVEQIHFVLEDSFNQLQLTVTYSLMHDMGTVTRSQRLTNLSVQPRMITRFLSGALDMRNQDFQFLHLSGAWLKERHIKKQELTQGIVSIGSLKGASGHQHNPFVALIQKNTTNSTGQIYASNLVYSGNFLAQVEVDEWDNVRLMSGIHPTAFNWSLATNESFETPEILMHYSNKGINGLMDETSHFIEKHLIAPKWSRKNRPVVFNNWEATYFDFNHDKLIALAKESKQLGMDCFVIDDGWFGKRNDDRSSLGDWFVDKDKLPKGMANFADEIHALGLQLGVWFEPEMVSPDSELYRQHPEWVVRPADHDRISIGRGQYVLDFANPEVVDSIYAQMKKIIVETNLDYIKWDMNRNITEAFSTYLYEQNIHQHEFFHRYILGVYRLYERILTDFPDVLIEGCAGGGGRYDLGILFYSPQIWPSDDSDAVERLAIQSGTLLGYPLSTFSNHVSASPNHQVQRKTSLKMRTDVAKFGPLGYELNLFELSEAEKKQIKQDIAAYKQQQTLFTFGRFYQLLDPISEANEYCWAVYDSHTEKGIINFYRILTQANSSSREFIQLPFVDESSSYEINGQRLAGSVLKYHGLRKPYQFNGVNTDTAQMTGDFQSFTFIITKVKGV